MQKMQSIAERWKRIEHEVQDAALSCGRNPHDITIVAVSKMHSLEYVQVENHEVGKIQFPICLENGYGLFLWKQNLQWREYGRSNHKIDNEPIQTNGDHSGTQL